MKKLLIFVALLLPCIAWAEDVTVFDFKSGTVQTYDVDRRGNNVSVYDYQNNTFINGTTSNNGDSTLFYNHKTDSFTNLNRDQENTYSTYDSETGSFQIYEVRPDGQVDKFEIGGDGEEE